MAGLLYRLGRFAARRSWSVIIAWLMILLLAGSSFALFGGQISTAISIPGTKTEQVQDRLQEEFPDASGGSGAIVFATQNDEPFTEQQRADIATLFKSIDERDGVKSATDPFAQQQQIDEQKQQLEDSRAKLESGQTQLDAAQQQADDGAAQLAEGQRELDQQRAAAEEAGQLSAAQPQLDAAQAQLDEQRTALEQGRAQIAQNKAQLAAGREELQQGTELFNLAEGARVVSTDGTAAIGNVLFDESIYEVPQELKTEIANEAHDANIPGVDVEVSQDIAQSVPSILGPEEIVGVVIAGIVLVIMLGTLIGAALPLLSAVLGVGVATMAALSFSSLVEFISVTPVLGVMLGLAVGIDYSLFILNRHRNQLKQGMELHDSIGLANGTAGNAVVFAGSTVIVALVALNITGIPFLGLMGTVGAVAVAVAILVATTFTPALLSLVGMRILRRKERDRIGQPVSRRKALKIPSKARSVVVLLIGIGVLATIALPATQMRLGLPDGSSESVDSSEYRSYKILENKFGEGQNGPLLAVAELQQPMSEAQQTQTQLAIARGISDQGDVSAVAPIGVSEDRKFIAYQVLPDGGPSSETTEELVHDLRELSVDVEGGSATIGVAGNASANIDVSEILADVLPLYLGVVVGLSLIILVIVFRSILVPVTATLGFVLSLLAAFGGLTAIFQWGWFGPIFDVHDPGPILSFLPIIQIGILFGLAMDYQLFLVSGMREAYAHGAPARRAVQQGLLAGRAVVTAAAIIMISVFAGFIFAPSSTIRPIGFALAFGVLLDAFVVRMLLIPAVMNLLGKSAWWLPGWLDRILPHVDVEGTGLNRAHAGASDASSSTGTAHDDGDHETGKHAAVEQPVDEPSPDHDDGPPRHRA